MTASRRWAVGLVVAAAFLWSAWAAEVSATRLVEGLPFMLDFIRRMVPPDLGVLGERTGHADRGYRVSCNCGPEGGQVVYHLHFHFTAGRR